MGLIIVWHATAISHNSAAKSASAAFHCVCGLQDLESLVQPKFTLTYGQ